MIYRYLPMLKSKAGEVVALENLTAAAKDRILPVIHICSGVSASFSNRLAATWVGRTLGVDGSFNFGQTASLADFHAMVATLRSGGVTVLPVAGYAHHPAYVQGAANAVGPEGLIVRVTLGALSSVLGWVAQHGWHHSDVDLVIDVMHIAAIDVQTFTGYVVNTIFPLSASLSTFRSVTLAAAAAPKDHSSLAYGINNVPRLDWALWKAVQPYLKFRLDYGDYITGHPDLTDPPGFAMANATVSARYTSDNEWIIIKGRSTGGPNGQPMSVQYKAHANTLSSDPRFGGVPACWADMRINLAAGGAAGTSGRTKWSEIAANRHLSVVAHRLP